MMEAMAGLVDEQRPDLEVAVPHRYGVSTCSLLFAFE
jgi:hypothetical protein